MSEQELLEKNVFMTQLEKFVGWCRKYSLWPMPFGVACCAIEFMGVVDSHYDISRFGAEAVRFSPRQADLMVVAGTIVDKMGPVLKKIYDQMSEPKWVISMGVCASSGGFYRAYHVMQGIDEIIPVDVYVPGCPPTPDGLLYALTIVQEMAHKNIPRKSRIVPFEEKERSVGIEHKPLNHWPVPVLELKDPGEPKTLVAQQLKSKFPDEILGMEEADSEGIPTVILKPDRIVDICSFLSKSSQLNFNMPLDVCGVDYLGRDPRFEVVYHLYSTNQNHRVRLRVPLEGDPPEIDSVCSVWKGVNWFEREAYDMFGIRFRGHPNLERILCHDQFEGHALRKDFDPGKRFKCTAPKVDLFTYDYDKENPPNLDDPDPMNDRTIINVGPSHPITHGTLRLQMELEGENIIRNRTEIGYLHRCFEKMSETHTYTQVIPYTDRLNYCSAFMNNAGYAHAVEKFMGVKVPERAKILRIILSEFSRMIDHQVCLAANLVDVGALTNYWYLFQTREEVYELLEACCGGRLTVSYGRIGGFLHDVPEDFHARARRCLKSLKENLNDVDKLITSNKIFLDRTRGIGVVSRGEAIDWGFTGPCLRASGIGYDVRKAHPYWGYDNFDFNIPVSDDGDTYARYLVRFDEMLQSAKIIEQAIAVLPEGRVMTRDKRVAFPDKKDVYGNIEGLMNHFKLVMHGIQPQRGEIYSFTEAANGELGFYIVSDGTKNPYRIKVRPPCFAVFQSNDEILEGYMLADVAAILGSWNIIAGELDR